MTQRNRRRRRRGGIGGKLAIAFAAIFAVIGIAVVGIVSWGLDVAAKAPPLSSCKTPSKGGNSMIYAADGTSLGRIASPIAHTPAPISRIPRSMQLATVAIEDQRFFEHD